MRHPLGFDHLAARAQPTGGVITAWAASRAGSG
jgi:hypothetical protein